MSVMKRLLLILMIVLFSSDSRSEGYHCYYQINNEHFAKGGEELRAYTFGFLIIRENRDTFYEVNDWSNAYDFRLLDRLDVVFENEELIHLYGRTSDGKTHKRNLTMYSFNLDKEDGYFTSSITTSYGAHLGLDGKCQIISNDDVWKFE